MADQAQKFVIYNTATTTTASFGRNTRWSLIAFHFARWKVRVRLGWPIWPLIERM